MNNIIDLVNACEITATNVHMREREVDGTLANDVLLHSAQSGYFSARAALEAAVTELEKDAKRYQWLREHNGDGVVEVSMSDTSSMAAWIYRTDDLDEAVDRAMEAK